MSNQKRLFIGISAILFVANLLVTNDFTSLWDGAEAYLFWQALHGERANAPLQAILSLGFGGGLFEYRMPGALVLLLSLPLYWLIGGKAFGRETTLYTLLIFMASLLMPNLAKVASGDVWAMVTQWLAFTLLIRYLKQPQWRWQVLFYFLLLMAVWVQPINGLVFLMGSSIYLYFTHPQGRNLLGLQPWLAGPALAGGLYALQLLSFDSQAFVIGWRTGRYLLWNFLGMLPFWGFWMAGLWESWQRSRKGEELARINLGALLFAVLGHSLALQGILALLVAKQIQGYFRAGYLSKPLVLAGGILHLVGAFFIALLLLVGGFHEFGPAGFRAAASAAGAYWMLSFVSVIGLVGMTRRYVVGGTVLAGLLSATLFWLQLNPLLENRRNWAVQLVEQTAVELEQEPGRASADVYVYWPEGTPFPKLAAYAAQSFPGARLLETRESLNRIAGEKKDSYVLLPQEMVQLFARSRELTVAEGWSDGLKARRYSLVKLKGTSENKIEQNQ